MEPDPSVKKTMAIPRLSRAEPSAQPSERIPFLKLLSGHQAGLVIVLEKDLITLGRDPACDVILDEIGVSRFHCSLKRVGHDYVLADEESTNGTFINDRPVTSQVLHEQDSLSLGPECLLRYDRQAPEEVELARRLFEGARLDGLTRVFNRATFFERLAQEISFSQRQQQEFGLLLFDIDHFKRVNDTYGHPAGDAVLREVADRVRGLLRLEDTLARYGGEEFAVLLRSSDLEASLIVAERIRARIADEAFALPGEEPLLVTISIGVACWGSGATREGLIASADRLLYAAKDAGRNRVCPRL
ncbi:GGDEF domain-containing protein [bacterium]|nr:GGDEF domain-containing protein [bacterium]